MVEGAGTGGPLGSTRYSVLGTQYSVRRRLERRIPSLTSATSRARSKPGGPAQLGAGRAKARPYTRGELPEAFGVRLGVHRSLRLRSGQALRCGCSLRLARKEQSSLRMTRLKSRARLRSVLQIKAGPSTALGMTIFMSAFPYLVRCSSTACGGASAPRGSSISRN